MRKVTYFFLSFVYLKMFLFFELVRYNVGPETAYTVSININKVKKKLKTYIRLIRLVGEKLQVPLGL